MSLDNNRIKIIIELASANMDLVILAAGMGSRFGGLKQLEPVDSNKNFIIDYSIFDAINSGFDRIVFIIRKQNEKIFKETIGNRIKSKTKIEYVFQENDSISYENVPHDRIKPLGTAHAILCCKNVVKSPFMIINADDFYGKKSYELAIEFMKNKCNEQTYGCITYEVSRTLTKNGSVKRGVCHIDGENISDITESLISPCPDGSINVKPLNDNKTLKIKNDTPVSMNMFILSPSIFETLDSEFRTFLSNMNDPRGDEFLLPDIISKMIKSKKIELKVIKSDETWFGVTYPEDKQSVINALSNLVHQGKYPINLWN